MNIIDAVTMCNSIGWCERRVRATGEDGQRAASASRVAEGFGTGPGIPSGRAARAVTTAARSDSSQRPRPKRSGNAPPQPTSTHLKLQSAVSPPLPLSTRRKLMWLSPIAQCPASSKSSRSSQHTPLRAHHTPRTRADPVLSPRPGPTPPRSAFYTFALVYALCADMSGARRATTRRTRARLRTRPASAARPTSSTSTRPSRTRRAARDRTS